MTCWVVIPVKASPAAKGRLAGVLGDDDRAALVAALLDQAVWAASQARGVGGFVLVGQSRLGQPATIELLADPGTGLNAAVTFARDALARRGASRLVTLAADLPMVTPADVEALCAVPDGAIGLATDRHASGTNALSLPLPRALGFVYGYGPGSREHHLAEAARLRLEIVAIDRPGLARDIDEPADLHDAAIWTHLDGSAGANPRLTGRSS